MQKEVEKYLRLKRKLIVLEYVLFCEGVPYVYPLMLS